MENRQKSIILLHGWRSSKENWEKIKKNLEKEGFTVMIPDLPGFKEETKLNNSWDLNNYIDWMEDFIKNKKNSGELTEPFFLLGHSFGGRIAIKFAVKHPEKICGLILISSAGIRPKKSLISNFTPFLKKLDFLPGYSIFRKIFYKLILRKTDYLKTEGALKETFKKIIEEDLTSILSQIQNKTLILWGEKDKLTPISDAYLMKAKIKNSKLEIFKGLSHISYLENPEIISKKILDFIK